MKLFVCRKVFNLFKKIPFLIYKKLFDKNLILLCIFFLGFILRELGTNPGSLLTHPDEPTIIGAVSKIIMHGDFKPVDYYYGSLLPLIYVFFDIFILPILLMKLFFQSLLSGNGFDVVNQLTAFDPFDPTKNYLYYFTRYETALISSFTAIAVYFLCKKLFNSRVGLAAAFFTAVNYRNVLSSTLALADAPAALFGILSLLYSVDILKSRSTKTYLKAAFFLTLSFSVKYFIYTFPAFILCHIFSVLNTPYSIFRKIINIFINRNLILSFLFCIILFFIINPYLLLDLNRAHNQLAYNAARYGLSNPLSKALNSVLTFYNLDSKLFSLVPIHYFYRYGIGETLSILTLIGFCYSLIRYFKKTLIILSVIIPFLFTFTILSAASADMRNYSAIIPFILILPSIVVADAVGTIRIKKLRLPLFLFLVFLIGYSSLHNSFLSSYYLSMPQDRKNNYEWAKQNVALLNEGIVEKTSDVYMSDIGVNKIFDISPWESDRNLTIPEMNNNGVKWAFIGSSFVSLRNSQFLAQNKDSIRSIFDEQKIKDLIKNTHLSLLISQLGDYRIKEFSKPLWQSMIQPSFMVIKVPKSQSPFDKKNFVNFDFEQKSEQDSFKIKYPFPCSAYSISFPKYEGIDNSTALKVGKSSSLRSDSCAIETEIFSPLFKISSQKEYILSGSIKINGQLPSPDYVNDGFIRLNFYSLDKTRIKTYVSQTTSEIKGWQTLEVSGIAPEKAKFANISFQMDYYANYREFLLDNFRLFEADSNPINKSEYPYYGRDIPESFISRMQL